MSVVCCVVVNRCDSMEPTVSTVTALATSDMQNQSVVNKAVPSLRSAMSVMIGNAENAAAAAHSVVMAPSDADGTHYAVFARGQQQISTRGDGSVVLTVSCPPQKDHPPVCSAATELTRSDVHSSTAKQSVQDGGVVSVTGSPVSQRCVVCVCHCWILTV